MKILNELVTTIEESEVVQNDDGTFSLKMTPKIYEDLYAVKERVDLLERVLIETVNKCEEHSDTMIAGAVASVAKTGLNLLE